MTFTDRHPYLVIRSGTRETTLRVDLPRDELDREIERLATKRWIGPRGVKRLHQWVLERVNGRT